MRSKQYIVEARDHDGSLITEPDKQPPFPVASAAQLHEYYSEHSGNPSFVPYETLRDWYESKGWFLRERTW